MSFTTHLSIIDGIRSDDAVAWNRFFAEYAPLIKLHGKDCGLPEAALDDLVQNVLLAVFSKKKEFHYDPKRGRYRDYIRFIIRARAVDMLRSHYRTLKESEYMDESEEHLDELFEDEWKEHIRKNALERLKAESNPQHFQVFHMLDILNRDVKYVSKFFNLPSATVYSIRGRMEQRLRQLADEVDI